MWPLFSSLSHCNNMAATHIFSYQECSNIPFTIKTTSSFFVLSAELLFVDQFDHGASYSLISITSIFPTLCVIFSFPPKLQLAHWFVLPISKHGRHVVDFIFCSDIFPKDKFPIGCIFMGKCSEMALPAGC